VTATDDDLDGEKDNKTINCVRSKVPAFLSFETEYMDTEWACVFTAGIVVITINVVTKLHLIVSLILILTGQF
jgi:hypothetical protein